MSIVTKLRCITLDVTGTLIAYKGELGEYYCMAVKSADFRVQTTSVCMRAVKLHTQTRQKNIPVLGLQRKFPTLCGGKLVLETLL